MKVLEVGKPYPFHNNANGFENVVSELNTSFFDVLYYAPKPPAKDLSIWKTSKIRYGVFVCENIPFFLVSFPGHDWTFDVSINFLKAKQPEGEDWIYKEDNMIHFYLINASTNVIKAMRMISIEPEVVQSIREACSKQQQQYKNPILLEGEINRIYGRFSTEEMIRNTKMFSV